MLEIVSITLPEDLRRKAEKITGEISASNILVRRMKRAYNGYTRYIEIIHPVGSPAASEFASIVLSRIGGDWFNQKMVVYPVPASIDKPELYYCYEFIASRYIYTNEENPKYVGEEMWSIMLINAATNFSGRGKRTKEAMDRFIDFLERKHGIAVVAKPASDLVWALST